MGRYDRESAVRCPADCLQTGLATVRLADEVNPDDVDLFVTGHLCYIIHPMMDWVYCCYDESSAVRLLDVTAPGSPVIKIIYAW